MRHSRRTPGVHGEQAVVASLGLALDTLNSQTGDVAHMETLHHAKIHHAEQIAHLKIRDEVLA